MHRPGSATGKSSDAPASWAIVSYQTKKEKEKPLSLFFGSGIDKNLSDLLDHTRFIKRLLCILKAGLYPMTSQTSTSPPRLHPT